MRSRLSLALIAGCVGAVVIYALARCVQKVLLPDPDPAIVFDSPHAGFYWRCWIAAYAGGTCAFVGWVIAGRAPERFASLLSQAVVVAAIFAGLQSVLVP